MVSSQVPNYTLDMYKHDHTAIHYILQYTKLVHIPQNEWAGLNIEGTIYRLNPNCPESDICDYFRNQYHKNGADYFIRYMNVEFFLDYYQEDLMELTLMRQKEGIEVAEPLLQTILSSYQPPTPPCIIPCSLLEKPNSGGALDFNKVINAIDGFEPGG